MNTVRNDTDNRMVWDMARRGHYEVWYLTFNHARSRSGYWIRFTMDAPTSPEEPPYAQVWFAYFNECDPSKSFGINKRYPLEEMCVSADPFFLKIGKSEISSRHTRGSLKGCGHEVSWDLTWPPAGETHRQLPTVMYGGGGRGDTTVLTPNLNVPLSGHVVVDTLMHAFDGEPGGQTHLWGKKHAHEWAWGHCNAFDGHPDSALEALTVRLKKGPVILPPLTIFTLYHAGEVYRWNQFRHTLFTKGEYGPGAYRFSGRCRNLRITGEFTVDPQNMLVETYEDPDGDVAYCLNSEVGNLKIALDRIEPRVILRDRRSREVLLSKGRAHFEIGARNRKFRGRNHLEI